MAVAKCAFQAFSSAFLETNFFGRQGRNFFDTISFAIFSRFKHDIKAKALFAFLEKKSWPPGPLWRGSFSIFEKGCSLLTMVLFTKVSAVSSHSRFFSDFAAKLRQYVFQKGSEYSLPSVDFSLLMWFSKRFPAYRISFSYLL